MESASVAPRAATRRCRVSQRAGYASSTPAWGSTWSAETAATTGTTSFPARRWSSCRCSCGMVPLFLDGNVVLRVVSAVSADQVDPPVVVLVAHPAPCMHRTATEGGDFQLVCGDCHPNPDRRKPWTWKKTMLRAAGTPVAGAPAATWASAMSRACAGPHLVAVSAHHLDPLP